MHIHIHYSQFIQMLLINGMHLSQQTMIPYLVCHNRLESRRVIGH